MYEKEDSAHYPEELLALERKNIATYLKKHKTNITHYFSMKETNAKAEALNQNLQRLISVNYGARNSDFFLYRINKHFS